MSASDTHLRLHLAQDKPAWEWARWLVLWLGLGGAALFVLAFTQAWWSFWLYAPQYPNGLRLEISLTGMSGDVHEVDLLNHYIGMAHLEDAAPMERRLAGYGVASIVVLSLGLLLAAGRRLNRIIAVPALTFPVVFIVDSVVWLYAFGHHLNPRAPLKIGAFTPQMFGNGKIGQFETYAQPAAGFWIAVAGVVCIVVAAAIRSRACAYCPRAATCKTTCPRLLVIREKAA